MSIKHDLEIVPGVTATASDSVIFAYSHQREKGEVQVQLEVYSNKARRSAYKVARDGAAALDADRQTKRQAAAKVRYIPPEQPDLSEATTPAERRTIMAAHQIEANAARADFKAAKDAAEAAANTADQDYLDNDASIYGNSRAQTVSVTLDVPADQDLTLSQLYALVMALPQYAGSIAD